MGPLQSKRLVRRILSLSVVFGALILVSEPSEGSQPVPQPAAAKKVPSPPLQPPRREFPNFQGRSRDLSLAKAEVHAYLFDLEPDDFVDIKVEQKGLDVTAKILAPGAPPSIKVDRWNGYSGLERIPLLARVAGRYTVELTGDGGGTYEFHASRKRKATVADRQSSEGAVAYSRGMELKGKQSQQAEREFRKALESWKASGFRPGQADATWELAKLVGQREDSREAQLLLEQISVLYHDLRNQRQEGIALDYLGSIQESLGNSQQAHSTFDTALDVADAIPAPDIAAGVLLHRGMLFSEGGEFDKALADLESALAWRREHDSPSKVAEALNAVGRVHYLLEDPDSALRFHREALDLLRKDPDPVVIAATLEACGNAYRSKGSFPRAISRYVRALAMFQAGIGHSREEAATLNNLGLAYFWARRPVEALGAFQHCQRVFSAQGNAVDVAIAWTNIGWILSSMNRFESAAGAYRKALSVFRANQQTPMEVAVYSGLSWSEWRSGHLFAAQSYIARALKLMESFRTKTERKSLRTSFLAGRQDLYDLQVQILMEQHRREPAMGYDLKAFEASERARSRGLLEDLEGQALVPALSVQDIQRRVLDENVVLLEYFLGEKRSFLWVVTRSTFASYDLPPGTQIEALARTVHMLMGESNKREVRNNAIRQAIALSRVLFGAVAGRLEGKKLLIVAPPALQYISFGALPKDTRDKGRSTDSWPTPWILDHEIVVEPSATALETLRRLHEGRVPPPGLIAVFADPVFSATDQRAGGPGQTPPGKKEPFPRLRFSSQEAAAIKAQAQGGPKLFVLGFDATRQRALASDLKNYRNIHFSTHGILDKENHDRSALVFSLVDPAGKSVEGFLRAGVIAKLDLPAELVVLSACQTGLGREIRGEGLVGLTQAFFAAGASRVMVSLWNVDDQATAFLMGRFYQDYFQRNLSRAAALKEAQVWMWRQKKWNEPSYWAGFILEGDYQ
jgi:CHAT domain-containing protein/Tfp pilus assembly protein PilF